MILRWAEQHSNQEHIQLHIQFVEEDVSGRRKSLEKRKGLMAVERAMKQGSVDIVVFEKLDRLSRDQVHHIRFLEIANENDVEIFEMESGKINLKDRGQRLGFNIKSMLAQEYSLELEEKITKKQREAMVNNGKDSSSYPTFGLDRHETLSCMYKPNWEELKIVESIMRKFVDLQSLVETSNYCHAKGYKDKERFSKEKTDRDGNIIPPKKIGGEPFTPRRLHRLLSNPKLRGRNCFEDTWNQFPRLQDENKVVCWDYWHRRQYGDLIDPTLLKKVDAVLEKLQQSRTRKAKDGSLYLLTGILKAPDGTPYNGGSAKGGTYKYYHNKTVKRRYDCKDVEAKVIKRVHQYLAESGTLEKTIQNFTKNRLIGLPALDEAIQETRAKVKQLEKAVVGFSDKLRTAATEDGERWKQICELMVEEKEKAEGELGELQRHLDALEKKRHWVNTELREKSVQDCFRHVLKHFDRKPDIEKKRIIQTIIPEAIIHDDHRLELRINPDPLGKANWSTPAVSSRHSGHSILGLETNWRANPNSDEPFPRRDSEKSISLKSLILFIWRNGHQRLSSKKNTSKKGVQSPRLPMKLFPRARLSETP